MSKAEGGEACGKHQRMIPIGRLIQEKLKEQNRTVVWLSQQMPCRRENLYKIFRKDNIDTEVLLRISQILHYDFFRYYSQCLKEKEEA